MVTKTKLSKRILKLKSTLIRRKPFIIKMPEERDDSIHWLFWLLLILVLVFLISIIVISWSGSSGLLTYINQ
jgi:Co/Zn/Cd efflux system component